MRKTMKKVLVATAAGALLFCSGLAISNVYEAKAESDYYVETTTFALREGASIRLNAPTGIRFTTTVADEYASGKEFGTIIVPKHLNDNDTVDIDDAANGLNIPLKNVFAAENGAKIYTAVVGNMPVTNPAALNLLFQAASYAKDGDSYTYTQTVTRSISQVASMAYLADSTDTISLGYINTAISGLSLSMEDVSVDEGKTVTLAINNLPEGMVAFWSSENEEVATVAEDGTVTAKKAGAVTIIAQIGDTEVSASVYVNKIVKPQTFMLTENTDFERLYASEDMRLGCTIIGSSPSVQLALPSEIGLTGPLTIKNVTLSSPKTGTTVYANGYKLYIDEDVTSTYHTPSGKEDSTYRLTVYGGANNKKVASTNITLLGGNYWRVYGGGLGTDNVSVSGYTNVIFGGNANMSDSINDDASNFVSSCLYGGANNARVEGSTYVTLVGENAKIGWVSGVGDGVSGYVCGSVNIHIQGGNVMNVYGGFLTGGSSRKFRINILMTGGTVEALFGGSQAGYLGVLDNPAEIGISLIGGEVTRRVIMGCYNEQSTTGALFGGGYETTHQVCGKITLNIGSDMKLCTGRDLSGTNNSDKKIYCGSRYDSRFTNETVEVNFLDGCESKFSSKLTLNSGEGYTSTTDKTWEDIKSKEWSPFY